MIGAVFRVTARKSRGGNVIFKGSSAVCYDVLATQHVQNPPLIPDALRSPSMFWSLFIGVFAAPATIDNTYGVAQSVYYFFVHNSSACSE